MAYDYIVEVDGTIDLLAEVEKFNPYHDRLGRFTTASGASSFTVRTKNPEKQHLADRAIERAREAGKTTEKTVDSCKNVGEVESLIKSKGWFCKFTQPDGKVWNENEKVSLEGCDLESAKGIYSACERVFTKLPEISGELNAIKTAKLDFSTMGDCHFGFGCGGITLNTSYYGNSERIKRVYQDNVEHNWSPQGTHAYSNVTHEFGHAVDDYLTNTLEAAGWSRNKPKHVGAYLRPKVMKACGKRVSEVDKEVSNYATKNAHEWFAECFAEWIDSPNPRPVAKEFGKQLLEIIRGEG